MLVECQTKMHVYYVFLIFRTFQLINATANKNRTYTIKKRLGDKFPGYCSMGSIVNENDFKHIKISSIHSNKGIYEYFCKRIKLFFRGYCLSTSKSKEH